ncbi:hypothetical protein [Aestuariivirga sp.]|uniref:hypothetical protein n=1 Tax=Aestuariivirga sp. TaxID=2650926 RepID=UPI0039E6904D
MNRFAAAVFTALFLLSAAPLAGVASADPVGAESAIMSAGSVAAKVRSLHPVRGIAVNNLVLELGPRIPGNDRAYDVRIMADRNAGGIAKLRSALNANPEARQILAKKGIPLSRIVGARLFSNGWIRIYIL